VVQVVEDDARRAQVAAETPLVGQYRGIQRAPRTADRAAQARHQCRREGTAIDDDRGLARRAELAGEMDGPARVEQRGMGREIGKRVRERGRGGLGAGAVGAEKIVELPDRRDLRNLPVAVQMRLDQARAAASGDEHDRVAARHQAVEFDRPGQRSVMGRQGDGRPHRGRVPAQSSRWAAHRRVT